MQPDDDLARLRGRRLTRKKKALHASERDRPDVQTKRRSFRRKVKRIEPGRLVFVDETGVTTAMTPAYAWAPRGERAVASAPGSWESVTVIAALGLDGVRAPLALPGSVDTAAFETYVEQALVPALHEGDVVVLDNLKPHKAAGVAAAIERAGRGCCRCRRTARTTRRSRRCTRRSRRSSAGSRRGRRGTSMTQSGRR